MSANVLNRSVLVGFSAPTCHLLDKRDVFTLLAGLIGWVPNTDTLHSLIREYRDARKIPLNVEHRLMLGMAPDYDHLTVIQKVEVFEHALDSTSGAHPCSLQHFYHHIQSLLILIP